MELEPVFGLRPGFHQICAEATPAFEERNDRRRLAPAQRRAPARSSTHDRLRLHVLIAADNAGRADATALKGQTAGAPFAAAIKKCAVWHIATLCDAPIGSLLEA